MKGVLVPHRGLYYAVKTSVATASIALLGGIALQYVTNDLLLITPLFVALPALNAMSGDLATIVTAHIGDPETSPASKRKLFFAMLVTVPTSALATVAIGLTISYSRGYPLDNEFVKSYSWFVLGSLSAIVLITAGTSVLLNKLLIKHRYNSDDVLIPVANVLASVLILLCVSLAAWRIF